jgi:hypothetical protein
MPQTARFPFSREASTAEVYHQNRFWSIAIGLRILGFALGWRLTLPKLYRSRPTKAALEIITRSKASRTKIHPILQKHLLRAAGVAEKGNLFTRNTTVLWADKINAGIVFTAPLGL